MSFWNGLKSALGFSPADEEEEDEYDASVPTYAVENPPAAADGDTDPDCRLERLPRKPKEAEKKENLEEKAEPEKAPEAPAAPAAATSDPALPGDLFDAVIQLFNSTMPEFITSSLSLESQRQYIWGRIDERLRARVGALRPVAASEAKPADDGQLDIAARALAEAREEIARLHEEIKKAQAGADRQKRALTDRITDLDRQLSRLRSDKERLLTSRKADGLVDASVVDEKDAAIKALNEQIEALKADIEKERTLKEQLEVKAKMTDAMINSLQADVASTRQQLEQATQELAVAGEIQEKLTEFEQVKQRKDAKIASLSGRIKSLNEELEKMKGLMTGDAGTVDSLRTENASLRRTIETNLYNQANAELKLRNEIKELRARLEKAETEAAQAAAPPALIESEPAPAPKRRRGRPRKQQSLENGLDNTDWLDIPSEPSRKFDADFGYHEPQRTVVPENDAQLSLF